MSGGVIDSFFIALGFKPDTSGLKAFQRDAEEAKQSILSIGTALTAFAAGFAVKEIAKIGSDFEQTRIQVAGFFTALGQSTDFDSALGDADEAMQMISAAAATLPGEAEEYQQVFMDTFSFVKGAVGGTIKEMTDFTNQLTAIGKAGKMDAGQIAREADELLSPGKGRAMTRNRLWMQLLPLMRRLEGQAHLTSEEFNAMTETKRADLMRRSFAGLQPMLLASAKTFDAMWGAAVSGAKKFVRVGTAGLFEKIKRALMQLNGLFFDEKFNFTALGQSIVDTGKHLISMVGNVVDFGIATVKWMGKSVVVTTALKGGLVLLGIALGAVAFEKAAGSLLRLVGGLMSFQRLLTGGLFLAIGLIAEDLYVFETGGDSVTGMLVERFGPAAKYITELVLGALGAALIWVNRQAIMTGINLVKSALGPLLPLILLAAGVWGVIKLWQSFGEKGHAAMVFVGAAAAALFVYMQRQAIMTGIGLFLMNLPLILIIATLVALAAAIYYVVTRWDTFGAGAKTAIVGVSTVLGVLIAAFVATKAAAVGAAIRMAVAWLVALGPVGLAILAVGALGVLLYEIIAHWEAITNAIYDAIDATAKFLGLSDDASGRKDLAARRKKSDAAMAGLGGGPFDKNRRVGDAGNDGESTDFLTKKAKGAAGAPVAPGAGGFDVAGVAAMAKQLLAGGGAGGLDIQAMLGGLGAAGGPLAAMNGAQAGAGGIPAGTGNTTNITVPNITITGSPDQKATAEAVQAQLDGLKRKADRINRSGMHAAAIKGGSF